MDEFAENHQRWSNRLNSAGSEKKELRSVLFSVLSCYSFVLYEALQKNVRDLSNIQGINEFVESLNDNELEEWKSIIQNGDWVGLVTHRTCLARFPRRYIVIRYWHSETSETS